MPVFMPAISDTTACCPKDFPSPSIIVCKKILSVSMPYWIAAVIQRGLKIDSRNLRGIPLGIPLREVGCHFTKCLDKIRQWRIIKI